MAAFCIKPSQYLDNIVPPIMIQQANETGFPLIVLPPDMQFSRITQVLSDELTRRRTALLRNTLSVNQMLTQTITEGANLDEIAFMISQLTGGSILIVDSVNNRHSIFLKEEDRSDFKADSESQMINTLIQRSQAHDPDIRGPLLRLPLYLQPDPVSGASPRAFIAGSHRHSTGNHAGTKCPGTGRFSFHQFSTPSSIRPYRRPSA